MKVQLGLDTGKSGVIRSENKFLMIRRLKTSTTDFFLENALFELDLCLLRNSDWQL